MARHSRRRHYLWIVYFYWTLSTSNLRVISVQAAPKTFPVDHLVFGSSRLFGQGCCLRGQILRAIAAKGLLGETNSPFDLTLVVSRVPSLRRGHRLIMSHCRVQHATAATTLSSRYNIYLGLFWPIAPPPHVLVGVRVGLCVAVASRTLKRLGSAVP